MNHHATNWLRTRGSRVLVGAALLFATAFVVAPAWLAGGGYGSALTGNAELTSSAADNFVTFWRSGDQALPAGMTALVEYWTRYHVAKAVTAGLVTIALAALSIRLWHSFTDSTLAGRSRRIAGVAGALATAGGFGAALLLMANVQGAIAPLSSVLSLVPPGSGDPAVAQVQTDVAQQLRTPDSPPPPLARMISDFGTYHAVLAVSAVVLAVAAVAVSVALFRSLVTAARSEAKRNRAVTGVVFALVGLCLLVLATANFGNAADPAQALLLFYAG